MKSPGRKGAQSKAAGGRSSSKAIAAMAVMGCFVLLYGWNSYFLKPKSKEVSEVKKELAASRKEESDLRANLAELKKLANDSQAREAELARLGLLVPKEPDLAAAILDFNDLAHQAQVGWSSFVPSAPSSSATGTSISISMKVGGTFGQVFDYLRRLEQLDRLVVVDNINLTGGAGSPGGPRTIDADIKARMFSAGSGAAAPATTAAAGKAPASTDSDPTKLAKAGG